MNITVGVDPGNQSGIAIFAGPDLVYAALVKSKSLDFKTKAEAIRTGLKVADVPMTRSGKIKGKSVKFYIEGQFIGGKGDPRRYSAVESQIESRTTWTVVAGIIGLEYVEKILPVSWQAQFGLAKGKRAWRIEEYTQIGRKHYPTFFKKTKAGMDNVAAAILLTLICHCKRDPVISDKHFPWIRDEYLSRVDWKSQKGSRKKKHLVFNYKEE